MKRNFFILMMSTLMVLFSGCRDAKLEGAIYIPDNGWQIKIPDSESPQCTGPRPDPEGCKAPCKPCFVFVCRNGDWERIQLPYPPGMCDGANPKPGEPVTFCPRTETGYCPPECRYCF